MAREGMQEIGDGGDETRICSRRRPPMRVGLFSYGCGM